MNNANPLVTVGIATFNRPESLRRALSCICQQTYSNLEIIVSDNASPGEATKRVVEDFMAKDNRLKYFCQSSNLGANANFQFVLDTASGDFFLWMSDDDWRAPSYIEKLLKELQTDDDAVLAFCDIAVLDEQGRRRHDFYATYLPYLRQFRSYKRPVRLMKFFLQDESLGKANLLYGLIRSCAIKSTSLASMCEQYGSHGLDNLIVFTLLQKGRLQLVEEMLYGVTAGNVKFYPTPESSGLKNKLAALASYMTYLLAYLRLTNGVMKGMLALLFPVKVVFSYWHIFKRKFASLS